MEHSILRLPNEVIQTIFKNLTTKELLPMTPICKQFYSLICLELATRLRTARNMGGYTLCVTCSQPSARFSAGRLWCAPIETDGLQELYEECRGGEFSSSRLERLLSLYSRFRPLRRDPDMRLQRHPAGDVPGSRTFVDRTAQEQDSEVDTQVWETLTIDANALWTQLQTESAFGMQLVGGAVIPFQTIATGVIRVWKNWLARRCLSRSFSDHSTIMVQQHHESRSERSVRPDPRHDPDMLWLSDHQNSLGVWLKVLAQCSTVPELQFLGEADRPVNYVVYYEEVVIRSALLLLKLEEAEQHNMAAQQAFVFSTLGR